MDQDNVVKQGRARLNLRLLPFLLILLILVELVWSARVWMMLFVALGGIWLFDFLWARSLLRGLTFQRQLRFDWAHVGDELEERFTLVNDGWAPALWVELLDHSNLPDYQTSTATGVRGRSENSWRIKHICTRRGLYTLGPTSIRTGTPFNLYTIELQDSARKAIMVMPAVAPLADIEVTAGGRAHEGRRRASSFERTVSASGVREYQPGDPVKNIHWRAVAHYDDLFVRMFESTPAGDWWIFLDLDTAAQAGSGEDSTLEHAVILAASLAARGLKDGRAVGLAANGKELAWELPQPGEPQRLRLMRTLAMVEPGKQPLHELLKNSLQAIRRAASIVVITPAIEGEWIDLLLSLRTSGAAPTVLLLDRQTFGGSGDTERTVALLAEWSISHYVIPRDMLGRVETDRAREGHWEWTVGATGRAIARSTPGDQDWRMLG